MKMKSENEVTQSYPTLSDPMDGVLEWGAITFSDSLTAGSSIGEMGLVLSH